MKKLFTLILAATTILGVVGAATALGDGNYRKGKYLFRKNCRACHMEGATGGQQGKELEPATLTMADWAAAFAAEKAATYACKDEWGKLGQEDINDIYTYLYKFAKDSPTPAKCK